jgi:nickel-dependent lactate racemase
MQVEIPVGSQTLTLDLTPGQQVEFHTHGAPAVPVADPVAAVRFALEHPHNFPPLRRALTAEDRVTVVLDEDLPDLAALLVPVLEHITSAGVSPEAITLLCEPSSGAQTWLEGLPDEYADAHVEVHQPQDRARLCYLASTGQGKRLYLNRSLIEADQLVVLSGRGYDPLTGYSGAESLLYPRFGDQAVWKESCQHLSLENLGSATSVRDEAVEVGWLLGAPFLVQVLVGVGGVVTHVLGGLMNIAAEGQRLLDETWRVTAERRADVVVAVVPGEAGPRDFAVVSRALGNAARAVRPKGRILLLTSRRPEPGVATRLFSENDEPGRALDRLRRDPPADAVTAYLWLSATERVSVTLFSDLPEQEASKLFVTPLTDPFQIQNLIPAGATWLILPDADRTLVDLAPVVRRPAEVTS